MLAPDVSLAAEPATEELAEIGVYRTSTEGAEHGLVALAAGAPYWLVPSAEGHRLLVERKDFPLVREQLNRFAHESTHWPPPELIVHTATVRADFLTPCVWLLVLVEVFVAQTRSSRWTELGALDAQAIFRDHEWWRPLTALFLHADASHLVANGMSGLLVLPALFAAFGRWRGWLLVCLASVMGNFVVAALHYGQEYRSLGASTAIFAALGLLTGRAIAVAVRRGVDRGWRAAFVPFAAGGTVLALYGAGGLHVDVGAHVAGFAAGLALGFAAIRIAAE
jgi:rhomboid protease GluP